jgi:sulfite exporter TauE/SafE
MNETLYAFSTAPTIGIMTLGFFLGLKHATEADHLAAVSTIVTERRNPFSSALIGGLWGVGHTISLIAAGVFVLVLNFQISERTERSLETLVGVMLTFLGLNVLRRLFAGGRLHFHLHGHGNQAHVHPHIHSNQEAGANHTHHGLTFSRRALFIGMVHGLAGSAALMLLVIPTIESRTIGFLYIAIFGVGSIGGMILMSLLVGLPFHLTAMRFIRWNRLLQAAAGLISIGLGLAIAYQKVVGES